jgi:hypothetical protein
LDERTRNDIEETANRALRRDLPVAVRYMPLAQAREIGATRVRVNVVWRETSGATALQTTPPRSIRWDWTKYDALIDAAARYGMRVQMTLTGPAPAWATSDRRAGVWGPRPALYAQWVRAAALHFKRRVDRYALWNEPNHVGWVKPLDLAPAIYRRLYTAGYGAIKRVDRRAQVLIGELVPCGTKRRALGPLSFLRDVTCASLLRAGGLHRAPRLAAGPCPGLRADGVAVHPYDYRRSPAAPYPAADSATIGSLGRLTGTLDALARVRALRTPRGRALDVYMTEFGYFNSGRHAISQTLRARYLPRAYAIAQRNRRVREVTQYTLVTPPPAFLGGYFDMSLIDRLGRPLPPYNTLSAWARSAARRGKVAAPRGPIALPPAPAR